MTEARIDQGGLYGLLGELPEVRVDEAGVYALADVGAEVRVDHAGMLVLVEITPEFKVPQAGMYVLAGGSPCTTRWAQVWTITRTDGEIFRFTSLDRDLIWNGNSYDACDSLVPSASEGASSAGSAGNMDLSGAVASGAISQHALASGLFDGAQVEAHLIPWDNATDMPRLLLKGTFGAVQHSDTGFTVEILGDGARLTQTPLVRILQPDCRHLFGDAGCRKDLGPLTVTGTVDYGSGARAFGDAARAEAAGYFSRGHVTFTTGDNAGISAEIQTHEAGGVFILWPRLAFPIAAGDQYSMTPGCTNLKASSGGTNGCDAWANYVNFGGFPFVPGADKAKAAADVR